MSRRFQLAENEWGGRQRRPAADADLDITPMIDVTFLLLIFFMVASTMQKSPDMDVPAARKPQSMDPEGAITFFITTDGQKGSVPEIRGEKKSETYTIEQFAAKVRAEALAGKHTILFQADGRVPTGFINEAMRSVRDVPGIRYHAVVREKRN